MNELSIIEMEQVEGGKLSALGCAELGFIATVASEEVIGSIFIVGGMYIGGCFG
jgi:hypothetical protein